MAGREYSQEEMKEVYDNLSFNEMSCKKRSTAFDVKVATFKEEIITKIDNEIKETTTAMPGDFILTGAKGERYVLKSLDFMERYSLNETGTIAAEKQKKKNFKMVEKLMKFVSPWGELVTVRRGDVIIRENGNYYGIEREVFDRTYNIVVKSE